MMILEKHQQLMDRLVKNHCDYYNDLLEARYLIWTLWKLLS